MLEALATLLAFQLVGEVVAHLSRWPVPGPVIGMALLFFAWPALQRLRSRLDGVADTLLANFGLLFVPAGVGVMLHAGLLRDWWAPLLVAVLVSTAATMAVTAGLFVAWRRRRRGGDPPAPPASTAPPAASALPRAADAAPAPAPRPERDR
jgi:holin-like protein